MKRKEIKLNSHILPDDIKNDMGDMLDKTSQVEIGFALCSKDNIIRKGRYFIGSSNKMIIDSSACEKSEKFLGAYHTHPKDDSYPSAEDLRYCGIHKTICTGGKDDNKIRCNTWKYEQPSVDEYNKMIHDIIKGLLKPENPKYQSNFGCINDILPLYLEEKHIKEKIDTDLRERESSLLSLKEPDISEMEIMEKGKKLLEDTIIRDIHANILKEEVKQQAKKYYSEVDIK